MANIGFFMCLFECALTHATTCFMPWPGSYGSGYDVSRYVCKGSDRVTVETGGESTPGTTADAHHCCGRRAGLPATAFANRAAPQVILLSCMVAAAPARTRSSACVLVVQEQ